MRVFGRFLFALGIAALIATPAYAQCDLYTSATDSLDPAMPGDVVTYTITVGNSGPEESAAQEIVNIELPPGVGPSLEAYLAGDAEAVAAYDALVASLQIDDHIWDEDVSGYYAGEDSYCEAIYLQMQDLVLPPGTEGNIYYNVTIPEGEPTEKVFRFDSDTIDKDLILNNGLGGCSDTTDDCTGIPCMGPRLGATPLITAVVEVVDDGAGGTLGCTPPVGFTPGNAALIDRADCAFELKAALAVNPDGDPTTDDGAVAVIIADHDDFTDSTVDPYDIINMACTDFCSKEIITAPSMFISWQDGQDIHAAIDAGETVTVTLGLQESGGVLTSTGYVWEFGGTASDSDDTNDTYVEETTVTTEVIDPPVAGFSYDPMNPGPGDMITFTSTSTGEIDTYAWDFGDSMGTSAEQNPTYSYAAEGTYTVSLTVTNGGGSDTATMDVTVSAGPPPMDQLYYLAAAAKAEGAEGSFFVTDLVINNTGMDMANIKFLWLPRQDDNSAPAESATYTIDAGVSTMYVDVLGEAFGVESGAVGALAIASDSMNLKLMSRTYNMVDAAADCFPGATFGQSIPGYHADDLIMANERKRILFFVENDAYRANMGLLNGTGEPLRIYWERFAPDGTMLDDGFKDLGPWGNTQLNQVFDDQAPVVGAYVDVWVTSGAFAAYGSVLDNVTSDPTTVLPQ